MSDARDFIASAIAELEPVVADPVSPFGYGVDVRHDGTDVDQYWTLTDPESAEGVVQSVFLRLVTPRGALVENEDDDLDYGVDVPGYLNRPIDDSEITTLSNRAKLECLKDDRVRDATVVVEREGVNGFRMTVRIVPTEPTLAVPEFTIAVRDGVAMLELYR